MTAKRQPTHLDLVNLANALTKAGVDYVVIGGAAMALHGFPRMTKDIDLLLPVDPANNKRLIEALKSLPDSLGAVAALRPEYMDEGYSTSFSGEIDIDILYVAADRVYGELRDRTKKIDIDGACVATLDVEGLLATKQTTREDDIPDRLKLERLRTALYGAERMRRVAALKSIGDSSPQGARLYADMALGAISTAANGNPNWKALESAFIVAVVTDRAIPAQEVAETLRRNSPGAVYPARQAEIDEEIRIASETVARRLANIQRSR